MAIIEATLAEQRAAAALFHEAGRDEVRRIGLTPLAFEDPEARLIAAVAYSDAGDIYSGRCGELLRRDDGLWQKYISISLPPDADAAVRAIRRLAVEHCVLWLPDALMYLARQIRLGALTDQTLGEIETLVGIARRASDSLTAKRGVS